MVQGVFVYKDLVLVTSEFLLLKVGIVTYTFKLKYTVRISSLK